MSYLLGGLGHVSYESHGILDNLVCGLYPELVHKPFQQTHVQVVQERPKHLQREATKQAQTKTWEAKERRDPGVPYRTDDLVSSRNELYGLYCRCFTSGSLAPRRDFEGRLPGKICQMKLTTETLLVVEIVC